MTEPIKQEIINNIFENGDKLITGPILQTVLIDMIDDVNVKDQEILSKTGSWDEAVTQIPNLATKAEVTNLSESVARDLENVVDVDLTGYATEQWVESQGYLKEHQDISNLATKTELTTAETNLQGNITNLSESVARDLANVSVPEGVATEAWVQSQDYASKTYVNDAISSSSVDLTGYATETWVQNQGYLKEHQDISGLATKSELTSVSQSVQTDISGLATKSELTSVSESVQTDITNLSESVANSAVWKKGTGTDSIVRILTGDNEAKTPTATKTGAVAIGTATTASGRYSHAEGSNTIASGWGSHAEGTNTLASGEYSHAEGQQTTASGNFGSHAEGFRTVALGQISHAEGFGTNASGQYSHAEGESTEASGKASHAEGYGATTKGEYSHAEGNWTQAKGYCSHAEGYCTTASNNYEHAQGRYNHSSENQIFSIGTGNGDSSRRNAVSVLEVDNSGSYTASFFVQNIGGYDGTNPEPGTNDLATVINGMSTGGGSSETLWKKGTGKDSIVQVITDVNEALTPKATGTGSIATGYYTTASGSWSHAEGYYSEASGDYSHVEGQATEASGESSHAEGDSTKALGKFGSHAEGRYTIASGLASHAEGAYTNASGNSSHAEGENTKASGYWSHAEGYYTNASGFYSHAEGRYTTASGFSSHAEGYNTRASNNSEHAQGTYNHTSTNQIFSVGAGESIKDPDTQVVTETRRNAVSILAVPNADTQVVTASFFVQNIGGYDGTNPTPGTNDLATVINNLPSGGGSSSGGSSETLWKKGEGQDSIVQVLTGNNEANTSTASGTGSIAVGLQTKASGLYSHAEGYHATASGDYSYAEGGCTEASGESSHAEGRNTIASGYYSHAEGFETKASGSYSHAEGGYTSASKDGSHAEGNYTEALGFVSHAEGSWTRAIGEASHAEGYWTATTNDYEHAQGRYNHTSPNQIFSIGTGNAYNDSRNAVSVLEVDNSGSYTSSFFVQNVGGYDGTNPTPGTNDLATVLNNTETWTFTLEDGSTVTKNIILG